LAATISRAAVDVDHLTAHAQTQHDVAAGVGQPHLVAVHPAGQFGVVGAGGERLTRVRSAVEGVSDPRCRYHLLLSQRDTFSQEQRPEPDHVGKAGIDTAVEKAGPDRVYADGGVAVGADAAPQ
jgi:hypothetical protein